MKRRVTWFLLVLGISIFSSCLSVDTEIDIRNENRIKVDLTYTIDRTLWDAGVFDAETPYRAIPLTRTDAQRIARSTDSRLLRYRVHEQDSVAVVYVRYRPADFAALERLFGGRVTVNPGRLTFVLSDSSERYTANELDIVEEIAGDHAISIAVRTPGVVRKTAPFGSVDRTGAFAEIPLQDVLAATEGLVWTVEWE